MKVKLIDIVHRFLPLAWHVFFIIFIAFHMTKEGMNIVVDSEYDYLIYLDIAFCFAFFIAETIWARRLISKWRISFFLLFIVLALALPPVMDDWKLFNTFIVIFSGVDLLLILLKMVKDSFYTEERIQNQKLPINQFTDKRKLVSRIVYVVSFLLLFVISFIVFYYNEVSLEALVILCFVGIIIVSIGSIIRLSISLKPMQKYIKKFYNDLDFEKLEKNILDLDEPKLHEETRNMMYIELWEYASFIDLEKADTYMEMTFQTKNDENLKRYNEASFWYLLNGAKYDLIKVKESVYKKLPHKKKIMPYLDLIDGNQKRVKFKKKTNAFEKLKMDLYYKVKTDILELNSKSLEEEKNKQIINDDIVNLTTEIIEEKGGKSEE